MSEVKQVYTAIAAVQGDLAKAGISKDQVNSHQKYKFRGIDDVYNTLAPLLAKHGLCILPRVKSQTVTERQGTNRATFHVMVEVDFDFVAKSDGSCHTVTTLGEAMDTSDKATNKAMSAAYKYAAFLAFAIPTEGDNDADATTHHVEPMAAAKKQPTTNPEGTADGSPSTVQLENFNKLLPRIKETDDCATAYNHVMQLRSRSGITDDQLKLLLAAIEGRKAELADVVAAG